MTVAEPQDRLGQVQSLVRAFSILNALRDADQGMTLTEIAGVAKLPRSTTHRLLATMNSVRYVEFDASTNRWTVGLEAFALGASFMQARDVGRLGRPIMRSLMNDVGETVNVGIATPQGVSYIAQARPSHNECIATPAGTVLPYCSTASGKVLLAFGISEQGNPGLPGQSPNFDSRRDATTQRPLGSELLRVRRQGFALDNQEHRAGVRCVAAPIVDRSGHARLSLSISGTARRMPEERLERLGQMLANAARRMSIEIGGLLAA
jgi:IclR family acetate operon transcriptional repressor